MTSVASQSEANADLDISSDRRTLWLLILIAVLLTGAGLRIRQYLLNRSYWHDEAAVVLNVAEKSPRELLGRLEFDQAAPPLFLLTERAVFVTLGGSELAMRLVPMLLSFGSLALFGILAWRLLPPPCSILATTLLALSDRIIWYDTQAKQYAGDVFFAIAITLTALGPGNPLRRLLHVALLATVAIWFSHAAALVFAGVSLALLPAILAPRGVRHDSGKASHSNVILSGTPRRIWHGISNPDSSRSTAQNDNLPESGATDVQPWRGAFAWLLLNLGPLISFLILYFISIRRQRTPFLTDYWTERFADYSSPIKFGIWLIESLYKLCDYPYKPLGFVLLLLAMVGAYTLFTSGRKQLTAILVTPILVTLLAALLHRYPFSGHRLTLFLAPAIFVLAAVGAERAWNEQRWLPRVRRIVLAALLAWALLIAVDHLLEPRTRSNIRPAMQHLLTRHRLDDVVYTIERPDVFWYWWPRPRQQLRLQLPDGSAPRRFWILIAFSSEDGEQTLDQWLVAGRAIATQTDAYIDAGSAAVLFERP